MAIKVRKGYHNPSSLPVMNFIHFIRYTFVHCMSLYIMSEFPKCVRAISKIEFEINTSNVTKQGIMFLSYKYTDTSIHIDISFPFVNKAEMNYYNQILLQKISVQRAVKFALLKQQQFEFIIFSIFFLSFIK